jgi:hypothetical protein
LWGKNGGLLLCGPTPTPGTDFRRSFVPERAKCPPRLSPRPAPDRF